jgi:hypothetical protein
MFSNKKSKIVSLLVAILVISLLSITSLTTNVFAQGSQSSNVTTAESNSPDEDYAEGVGAGEFKTDCIETELNEENCGIVRYLVVFTNALSALVGIVVVIMLAIGGIQYSTSHDNPQAVQAAKKRIANALLALVAYFFLFGFLQWIIPGGLF